MRAAPCDEREPGARQPCRQGGDLTDIRPEPWTEGLEGLEDANLLVSILWWAPGRARREIVGRLRALGDASPLVAPTSRRGLMAVRTSLDARTVVRALRELAATRPEAFRTTCK